MAQQTAKDLMKNFGLAMAGKPTSSYTSYLQDMKELLTKKANVGCVSDLTDKKIEEVLRVRVCYSVVSAGKALHGLTKEKPHVIAWNEDMQSDLIECSKFHCDLFIYNSFMKQLEEAKV